MSVSDSECGRSESESAAPATTSALRGSQSACYEICASRLAKGFFVSGNSFSVFSCDCFRVFLLGVL